MFKNLPKIENRKLKILLLPLSHIQRSSLFIVSLKHSLKIENWKLKIFRNFLVHAKYFYLIIAQLENSLKIKNWKLKIILLLFFLLSFSSADAATLIRPPNNLGLVGYWSFNEGAGTQAGDGSGNGNTGTLTNGPTWADGRFGKALSFDGTNDYVVSGLNKTNIGNTPTISMWIRPTGSQSTKGIFQIANALNDGSPWALLQRTDSTTVRWYLEEAYRITQTVNDDTWYHLALVYNGTTWTAYKNGLEDGTYVGGVGSNLGNSTWLGNGYNGYFFGFIDEVRIYNRALSASEISTVYRTGSVRRSTPTNLGLIAHWSFNDGSGTQAGDFSGNGNTGTISGASWIDGKLGKALDFDGVNDYVNVSNSSSLNITSAITISMWVRHDSSTYKTWETLIAKGDSAYRLHLCGGAGSCLVGATLNAFTFGLTGPSGTDDLGTTIVPNVGQWYHVVGTYDGSVQRIYVDGIERATQSRSGSISTNSLALGIAENTQTAGRWWDGPIDEVRIYNRALSADEVATIYRSGETKFNTTPTNFLTDGLVGHWTFDGKDMNWTTGTLSDKSSQGNNGQVASMSTTTTPTIGKIGQAFSFNGSNSRVTLGDVLNIDLPVTVSAWINTNTISVDQGIFANDRSSGSYTGFWFQINNTGTIGTNYGDNTGVSSGNRRSKHSSGTISAGSWHHVVGVIRAATDMDIYIDGVDAGGTYSGTGGAMVNTTKTGLIGDIGGVLRFNGLIDETRVYNRSLSAFEVQQLYLMGK